MNTTEDPVIIYDGDCLFCKSAVKFLKTENSPGGFRFVPSSEPDAEGLLHQHHIPADTTSHTVIMIDKHRIFTKSTAIIKALQRKGPFWRLSGILFIIPAFIRNWVYDWIARNRK